MTLYSFKNKKSLSLRIWHLLTGLTIFALLFTVFLREFVLDLEATSVILEARLKNSGTVVSSELVQSLAKDIRNPVWEWHYYIGFFLIALTLFRLVIFLKPINKEINPFTTLMKLGQIPSNLKDDVRSYALVRLIYALFYVGLAIAGITGFVLYFKKELGIPKNLSHEIVEVHELNMWCMIIFIALHIIGVVIAENKPKTKGIVSRIINGRE